MFDRRESQEISGVVNIHVQNPRNRFFSFFPNPLLYLRLVFIQISCPKLLDLYERKHSFNGFFSVLGNLVVTSVWQKRLPVSLHPQPSLLSYSVQTCPHHPLCSPLPTQFGCQCGPATATLRVPNFTKVCLWCAVLAYESTSHMIPSSPVNSSGRCNDSSLWWSAGLCKVLLRSVWIILCMGMLYMSVSSTSGS